MNEVLIKSNEKLPPMKSASFATFLTDQISSIYIDVSLY